MCDVAELCVQEEESETAIQLALQTRQTDANLHLAIHAPLENQVIIIAWIALTVYALLIIKMDCFDGTRQQADFSRIKRLKQPHILKRSFDF
jgi:hypothetical protein